jgi:esterase/lipase
MTWRRAIGGLLMIVLLSAALGLAWRTREEARRLVSNPIEDRRLPTQTPIDFGMVYDDVSIVSEDGLQLAGWSIPTTNGVVIVALHGYKASRGEMLNEAAMLERHGYGVLLPALRAHDMSDGDLITFGRREIDDLRRWVQFAQTLPGVRSRRIGIIGNSLGGTLAIQAAAVMPEIGAVATNSAFSSLTDTVETSIRFFTGMPPFPFAPLIVFWAERQTGVRVADVDATRAIGRISPRPVLIMQGGADEVISTASGQRLYDAAGEPRDLWFDALVGHTRFDTARPAEYEQRVVDLFDAALMAPND